jgi:hypothetical protein
MGFQTTAESMDEWGRFCCRLSEEESRFDSLQGKDMSTPEHQISKWNIQLAFQ